MLAKIRNFQHLKKTGNKSDLIPPEINTIDWAVKTNNESILFCFEIKFILLFYKL